MKSDIISAQQTRARARRETNSGETPNKEGLLQPKKRSVRLLQMTTDYSRQKDRASLPHSAKQPQDGEKDKKPENEPVDSQSSMATHFVENDA